MAAPTGRSGAGPQVPPALIAVAAVVLLVFIGWLAYANLFAPPPPKPMTQEQKSNQDWIADKIKETGGDMSKLSKEDQEKLHQIAGNWAALAWEDVKKKRGL
jgi:hypothetical protein